MGYKRVVSGMCGQWCRGRNQVHTWSGGNWNVLHVKRFEAQNENKNERGVCGDKFT